MSDRDDRIHLAVKYNLTPNTVIRAEYEKGRTSANKANNQEIGDTVMQWFNAGRPVKVVTATENALGITRNGTGIASVMVTPIEESPGVFVFGDYRGQGITQQAGSALITNPTIVDPVNFKVNIGGAGQIQAIDFYTVSAFVEHKLFKNTFVQLAYNHQESVFHAWQSRNNTGLKGDPNPFLQNGVTPNPHAGQMYFENWWTNYNRWDKIDNYRLSVTANVTKNWRLTANYSITDSVTTNESPEVRTWAAREIPYFQHFNQGSLVIANTNRTIDQEIANWQDLLNQALSTEGLATIGNRREKLNLLTRNSFSEGHLKGLYVGGSARHQGKVVIAARSDNPLLHGNSFTRAGAFVGYRFGRVSHLKFLKNVNVQLNVFNVLNQHDPLVNRVSNANAAVLEVNRLISQEPTFWRLSADLSF